MAVRVAAALSFCCKKESKPLLLLVLLCWLPLLLVLLLLLLLFVVAAFLVGKVGFAALPLLLLLLVVEGLSAVMVVHYAAVERCDTLSPMVGVFERGICRGEPLSYESWHEESSVSFFPTTLLARAFFARSMYYLILWFMLLVLLLLLLVLLLRCYCFDVNDDFGWGLWQQHQQLDSDTARRILWLLSDCGASHRYIMGKGVV